MAVAGRAGFICESSMISYINRLSTTNASGVYRSEQSLVLLVDSVILSVLGKFVTSSALSTMKQVSSATRLRARLLQVEETGIIVAPGVFDGLSARVALSVGFECLYMVGDPFIPRDDMLADGLVDRSRNLCIEAGSARPWVRLATRNERACGNDQQS